MRERQRSLRIEMYKAVRDAMSEEDVYGNSVGKPIILPTSFILDPRYMFQKYQDAMVVRRFYG